MGAYARERVTRASAAALPSAARKGKDAPIQLEVDERGRKGLGADTLAATLVHLQLEGRVSALQGGGWQRLR